MRYSLLLVPILALCYFLDSHLPKFYIFDPARLQELSQAAIAAHPDNATLLIHTLAESLQKEYGSKHVNTLSSEDWFFK